MENFEETVTIKLSDYERLKKAEEAVYNKSVIEVCSSSSVVSYRCLSDSESVVAIANWALKKEVHRNEMVKLLRDIRDGIKKPKDISEYLY